MTLKKFSSSNSLKSSCREISPLWFWNTMLNYCHKRGLRDPTVESEMPKRPDERSEAEKATLQKLLWHFSSCGTLLRSRFQEAIPPEDRSPPQPKQPKAAAPSLPVQVELSAAKRKRKPGHLCSHLPLHRDDWGGAQPFRKWWTQMNRCCLNDQNLLNSAFSVLNHKRIKGFPSWRGQHQAIHTIKERVQNS